MPSEKKYAELTTKIMQQLIDAELGEFVTIRVLEPIDTVIKGVTNAKASMAKYKENSEWRKYRLEIVRNYKESTISFGLKRLGARSFGTKF